MPRNKPQVGSVPKNLTGYITNKRTSPNPTHYQEAGVRKTAFDVGRTPRTDIRQKPTFPDNTRKGTPKMTQDRS